MVCYCRQGLITSTHTQSHLIITASYELLLLSFLFQRWSNWDSRSGSDLPQAHPEIGRVKAQIQSKGQTGTKIIRSPGQGGLPGGSNASPFRDHVPLHLLSPSHTPSVILVPFSQVLAVTVSIPVHPDLDLKEGNINLVAQCNRLWVYLPRGFKSWPCHTLSWVNMGMFVSFSCNSVSCKMGMIIIYLILLL